MSAEMKKTRQILMPESFLSGPLPGKASHLKMAPFSRRDSLMMENKIPQDAKVSAVLVLLVQSCDECSVLFIKRSDNTGVHSGQIAFPGGKKEKSDRNFMETALRETQEELGIRDGIEVIGELTPLYVPPSNFVIHPVLAVATKREEILSSIRTCESEVCDYKLIPLSRFTNNENIKHKEFKTSYFDNENAPYYEIDDYHIWGATAMILSELIDAISSSHFRHLRG